jgi:hypothetical protein
LIFLRLAVEFVTVMVLVVVTLWPSTSLMVTVAS